MPYPNSQTPVTIRLNDLFCDRAPVNVAALLSSLQNKQKTLAQLAVDYQVAPGPYGSPAYNHVDGWPKHQQGRARYWMTYALVYALPIWFDWQNHCYTSTECVLFSNAAGLTAIGVTFKSPLSYPPYWGP